MKIHEEYSNVNIDTFIHSKFSRKDASPSPTIKKYLQLETKIPLPKFYGDVRTSSRFRNDFVNMVMPSIDKQCLSKDIEKSIASCEDDIEKILQGLDDKYADPGNVIDSIINEIRRFKGIKG